MRLLFHTYLEGENNPYEFVINVASQTVEECYRLEQGRHHCVKESANLLKDRVRCIEHFRCDPKDSAENVKEFLSPLLEQYHQPHLLFRALCLQQSQGPKQTSP